MRLLKRTSEHDLQLVSVSNDRTPPYAILSHTWSEGQEVAYGELLAGTGKDKTGHVKILFCLDRAAEDGIEYCWVDTCCIDKSAHQELQTAINSMFRWYQSAAKCYVYLSDVEVPLKVSDAAASPSSWIQDFRQSRWFTRGWTLQELLAPTEVEFFSGEGKRLGSKITLEREVYEITKIPVEVLRGQHLSEFSIDERMSWSAQRTTTLKEDRIYSLLGIFGVYLPLIYGEGEAYAELRLREEVEKRQKGKGQVRPLAMIPEDGMNVTKPHASYEGGEGREKGLLLAEMPSEKAVSEKFEKAKQAFIRSLSFPEMESRYHAIEEAFDRTCQWLLQHPVYWRWRTAKRCTFPNDALWVKGKPGAGKSTLMKTAYTSARLACQGDFEASQRSVAICFFFNARGARLERSPEGLLRSILHQLCVTSGQVDPKFVQAYSQKTTAFASGWTWSEAELRDMLKTAIEMLKGFRMLMYVDALDECEEKYIRKVVDFLKDALQHSVHAGCDLRICVSSRHYPNIRTLQESTICVELENRPDISAYVRATLNDMGRHTFDLHDSITNKAAGIFLWPVLVFQKLREAVEDGEPQQTFSSILTSIPEDLDDLFRGLVAKIAPADRAKATSLMLWVLFARRPLSVSELRLALAFDTHYSTQRQYEESEAFIKSDGDAEKLFRKWSRGLVEVKATNNERSIVQFVHESVREFLLTQYGLDCFERGLSVNAIGLGHCRLARACFTYLNIEDLIVWKQGSREELAKRHPFLEYAIKFAFAHVREAQSQGMMQIELVTELTGRWKSSSQRWLTYYDKLRDEHRYRDHPTNLFYLVCEFGLESWVQFMITEGFDLNKAGGRYGYALIAATAACRESIVQKLLESGANVDACHEEHGTALTVAAFNGFANLTDVLIGANAKVNMSAEAGTPLSCAAYNGDIALVYRLLENGAKLDIPSTTHPLAAAALNRRTDTLRLLLETADRASLPLDYYLSALDLADHGNFFPPSTVTSMLRSAIFDQRKKHAGIDLTNLYVSVNVKTLGGRNISVNVSLSETGQNLKEKIELKDGWPTSLMYLFFRMRRIFDGDVLFERGLYRDCMVHVIPAYRACGRQLREEQARRLRQLATASSSASREPVTAHNASTRGVDRNNDNLAVL